MHAGRMRRRLRVLALLVLALAASVLAGAFGGTGAAGPAVAEGAGGEAASEEVTAQTDDSVPLRRVTMIGTADGETWGIGKAPEGESTPFELVRYTPEGGWTLGPQLLDASGQPLKDFTPDQPSGLIAPSPLAGQMTAGGSGVLVGDAQPEGGGSPQQVVLVRNPGSAENPFEQTPSIEAKLLGPHETLFPTKRAPLIAPLDEGSGRAGAFIVPFNSGETQDGVLHWNGEAWTREEIEVPGGEKEKEESDFQVLGIGASSPTEAWLLVQPSRESESLALYQRVGDVWKAASPAQISVPLSEHGEEPLFVPGSPERVESQLLTVTSQGVWIDGERAKARVSATVFFKPTGSLKGEVLASWCPAPSEGNTCTLSLPEDLPAGPSRSIAWANPSTKYGERVITGLREGTSLRLEGEEFKRVLALGGSNPPEDPGGSLGAAFTGAKDGWLGSSQMPVHLTLNPVKSDIEPWPVPFRHALFAIAPQPGVPVGEHSEALAVGDSGEVARYVPAEGWVPETLFGPGGRRETGVRLRAVAWPTPTRAYAVGDESQAGHPQMWLWRGETELWEPDPAIPLNFRGSLLGIAFDPEEPSRGYAVGSDGVLLRYGKTWTQEALPEAAQGASFTSIAFAGSEALVAFHRNVEGSGRVGGLLANDGTGWHIDESAAAVFAKNVPTTVAGLPDGSAAIATTGQGLARVYERNGAGGEWRATVPLPPPAQAPGSLALFREGEALRVIAAGQAAVGEEVITPPPPGFPPTLEEPLPVPSSQQERGIVRQTADGWEDEEHELNLVKEPPADYRQYDMVYQPDPIDAVLVGATGAEGWAVGGQVSDDVTLDTSDVEHYAANDQQPAVPGVESAEVISADKEPLDQTATFAIGGDAQCNAPCAARANAKIGPDVWLEHAVHTARAIHGVRAFLYTGPRLSTGETEGPEPAYPFSQELTRYSELLGVAGNDSAPASLPAVPVFAATSPADLDNRPNGGTEALFEQSFAGSAQIPEPLGKEPVSSVSPTHEGRPSEHPGCPGSSEGCLYYAFDSSGEGVVTVRVIVLDDTTNVGTEQLHWLERQLEGANADEDAAIVIGDANLNAQIAAHNEQAKNVEEALVRGKALAYFYDSPEENVEATLGASAIKTYGSGTLGYVTAQKRFAQFQASGFLLVQVNAKRELHVSLIPNVGELALEAEAGTLLRTSEVAAFSALARRPRAGGDALRTQSTSLTDPYIQLPSQCVTVECPIQPDYEFKSSNEAVGGFVERNFASPEPNVPELNPNGTTKPDPQSGLFCAYKQGTTEVSIIAGGLSSKLTVTVQKGSERRPCVPPSSPPKPAAQQQQAAAPPPPAPSPTPAGAAPAAAPPVVPLPPAPPLAVAAPPAPARPAPPAPPFFLPSPPLAPVLAFVPPPVPTPARPTPPSGTSAVTSPVEVAESEEDYEEAPESVSNKAVAYEAPEQEPSPLFVLGIVALAALAGASVRRRGRSGGRELRVAPATLNGARQQQRMERDSRWR